MAVRTPKAGLEPAGTSPLFSVLRPSYLLSQVADGFIGGCQGLRFSAGSRLTSPGARLLSLCCAQSPEAAKGLPSLPHPSTLSPRPGGAFLILLVSRTCSLTCPKATLTLSHTILSIKSRFFTSAYGPEFEFRLPPNPQPILEPHTRGFPSLTLFPHPTLARW